MKNQHNSVGMYCPAPICLCCILFLFLFLVPISVQSQSLFDLAVELDSLYNISKDNKTVAQPFFDKLQKLYSEEEKIDPVLIMLDFEENSYLFKKVEIVYKEFNMEKLDEVDQVAFLEARRDSLFQVVIGNARRFCMNLKARKKECPISEELEELELNYEKDVSSLTAMRAKLKTKALKDELKKIETKINNIDREIEGATADSESMFEQRIEGGTSLPFGGNAQPQIVAPIVLQQQGGGSIQGSLIDGASKWIAQRMKEELSIAFFDRFENWAEGENIKSLFPNTFSSLKSSVTTDYSLMIQIFRTAFEKDLRKMPFNLSSFLKSELEATATIEALEESIAGNLIEMQELEDRMNIIYDGMETGDSESMSDADINQMLNVDVKRDSVNTHLMKKQKQLQKINEVLHYVLFTSKAIELLSEGEHPTTLLTYLAENIDELFPHSGNVKPALIVMDVISRSMISSQSNNKHVWLKPQQIARLKNDSQLRDFYFGLIYQEVKQSLRRERNKWEEEIEEIVESAGRLSEEEVAEKLRPLRAREIHLRDDLTFSLSALVSSRRADNLKNFVDANLIDGMEFMYSGPMKEKTYVNDLKETMHQLAVKIGSSSDLQQIASHDIWDKAVHHWAKSSDFIDGETFADALSSNKLNKHQTEAIKNIVTEIDWGLGREATADGLTKEEFIQAGITDEGAMKNINYVVKPYFKILGDYQSLYNRMLPFMYDMVDEVILTYHSKRADALLNPLTNNKRARKLKIHLKKFEQYQDFVNDLLLDNKRQFGNLVNDFSQLANRIDYIQSSMNDLRKEGNANMGTVEFVYQLKNSLKVLHQVYEIALPEKEDKTTLSSVLGLTDNLLDAYTAVLEKDYDAIVMNIIPIADSLLELSFSQKINKANLTADARLELKKIKLEKTRKMHEIFKYGAFLAAVVESKDANEIKGAISAIASPSGSYSIKRRSARNISLNAYPGITGGMELAKNSSNQEWAPNFGFTAPIGLAINWGYKGKIRPGKMARKKNYANRVRKSAPLPNDRFFNGHSGTLFFPLIDLGAIVLFRLSNDEEALPDDVNFQQVFSPGVMYSHGLANVPISISGGMQISPQLRKIDEKKANSFRFNLSVVVDLPIANFYTKRE